MAMLMTAKSIKAAMARGGVAQRMFTTRPRRALGEARVHAPAIGHVTPRVGLAGSQRMPRSNELH
jgi:hypothetical protein